MANWMERAKREILQSAGRTTANTAERNQTAVTAVPDLGNIETSRASNGSNGGADSMGSSVIEAPAQAHVPMTTGEQAEILAWLAHIEETDGAIIAEVLSQCRADMAARAYFVWRSCEMPHPIADEDDRRRCNQCANLTARGLCLAARRGEILASRNYEPVRDLPCRCDGYLPGPSDPDRRAGRDRWRGRTRRGSSYDMNK